MIRPPAGGKTRMTRAGSGTMRPGAAMVTTIGWDRAAVVSMPRLPVGMVTSVEDGAIEFDAGAACWRLPHADRANNKPASAAVARHAGGNVRKNSINFRPARGNQPAAEWRNTLV